MDRPLAIDLFTGLHGWAEGLIDAGWYVIGVDIEDMSKLVGEPKPDHFSLLIQNVLTLHGRQFKDARLIVSSSPCTDYSYMAMPFSRGKAKAAAIRADKTGAALRKLNELFDAQFRIQREASEAAGRHIPMVCENVCGAAPWVGRSKYHFGSYHLYGDVPALMPAPKQVVGDGLKRTGRTMCFPEGSANPDAVKGRTGKLHWQDETSDGRKVPGFRFDGSGRSFQTASVEAKEGLKHGGDWFSDPSSPSRQGGQKVPAKGWFNDSDALDRIALKSSKSPARKAASAKIAKIPLVLSTWIGQTFLPR